MAGLNLTARGGGYASAGVSAGLPASYGASNAGATISSRAYGIGSDGPNTGPATASVATTVAGVVGALLLGFIWYSLPR